MRRPARPIAAVVRQQGVNLSAMTDDEGGAQDSVVDPSPGTFSDLYRDERQAMVRLAFLLTAGSPFAEELVQDAFMRVHARWDHVEHPRAYLRRAVVNGAASHRRRQVLERRSRTVVSEAFDQPVDELRDAVARLPQRQRAAVVLRYYDGRSDAEIADALGCRVPAVKSLLHRALRDLRKVVER